MTRVSGVKNGLGVSERARWVGPRGFPGDENIAWKISAASSGVADSIFARSDEESGAADAAEAAAVWWSSELIEVGAGLVPPATDRRGGMVAFALASNSLFT